MRSPVSMRVLVALLLGWPTVAAAANVGPWQRTEARQPCAQFNVLRNAYFGDTHVHTTYSFDAVSGDVRTGPRDAYRFAQGHPIDLPPYDSQGHAMRSARLGRPLDFTAVTDHAELFGEVQLCLTPGSPVYDSPDCIAYRSAIPQRDQFSSLGIQHFAIPYLVDPHPVRFSFCGTGGAECLAEASLVWQDIQAAAEQFYDRTAACGFTTFVAYEWAGNTGIQNLHRNIIFRNEVVPPLPISYIEQPTPQGLWGALEAQCLQGPARCDVLAIPHNSNISNGIMFLPENADGSPLTAPDAAFRADMEPLVELIQHKGESECRTGVMTNDELCGFEKWSSARIGLPPEPGQQYPPLLYVRNALKEGLVQEERLGVNPFRLGFIGSTDTHNATPGATREDDYKGHLGTRDATAPLMLTPLAAGLGVVGGRESNAGGLAVVWAEENSRDALFAAMRRRETYATSGTRPIVRFFGGTLAGVACGAPDFVERSYRTGAPMGGELGQVLGKKSPRFSVLAVKDPGEPGISGTPLQRIQIIKGWVDGAGHAQEKVFEVAGDPNNGASVDPATCTTSGRGFDSLCTVWRDPEFDRTQRAFYYARVIENPVCRWSTRLCNAEGVDCTAGAPTGLEACCDPAVPQTIQERAWSSPIWYRPEGIAQLTGSVRAGTTEGRGVVRLMARIGRVPAGFDPNQALTIDLADDHAILHVAIPAGTLRKAGRGRLALPHAMTSGLASLTWAVRRNHAGVLRLRTMRATLAPVDPSAHVVDFDLRVGTYHVSQARLWEPAGKRLATAD